MKSITHTRAGLVIALGLAAFLLASRSAVAATTTFGGVEEFVAGQQNIAIYDYEIARLIDQSFTGDGSGPGVVDADIVIVMTSCYGGSFLENFNSTIGENPPSPLKYQNVNYGGGSIYDTVSFTNTTFMSASAQGECSFYTGYHDDVAVALELGGITGLIHGAGVSGRGFSDGEEETPLFSGSAVKVIGGSSSTHVLIWLSSPNPLDEVDALNLELNFSFDPSAEISILSNSDPVDASLNVRRGPATIARLKAELARIGPLITPGEQFILFMGDHGTNKFMKLDSSPVGAKTTPPGSPSDARVDADVEVGSFAIEYLFDAEGNEIALELMTADSIVDPSLVIIEANGTRVGTLADATLAAVDEPGLGMRAAYTLPIPETVLALADIQTLTVVNDETSTGYTFDRISLQTGNVPRLTPIVPVPGLSLPGGVLLIAGLLTLGVRRLYPRERPRG